LRGVGYKWLSTLKKHDLAFRDIRRIVSGMKLIDEVFTTERLDAPLFSG
jgi:hypothetical protein